MQYDHAGTKFDTEPLPLPYRLEEQEAKRLFPERESPLEKIKGLMFKSLATPMPSERAAPAETKPVSEPGSGVLGHKIKEALQTDYDPEESLAAIRAILVGPTRRLHDARIEEIVTILEETDSANKAAFSGLEKRHDSLSGKVDHDLRKAVDQQMQYLSELSRALDAKLQHVKTEVNGQIEEQVSQSAAAVNQMSRDMASALREQEKKIKANIDALTTSFEERFLKLDEYAETVQQHSAEVFVEGLNDIAKRFAGLRRTKAA